MTQKTLYFVSKEKKVIHIGFINGKTMEFLDSPENLSQHGFEKDPDFFRETDAAVYVFSSFLPETVVDQWFTHILRERDEIIRSTREHTIPTHHTVTIKQPPKSVITPPDRVLQPKKSTPTTKIKIPPKNTPPPVAVKRPPRKKNIETLKEEIKAQRIWDPLVPTCGECAFWEKRVLQYTQVKTGECTITGNFVDFEKKACSEFQK